MELARERFLDASHDYHLTLVLRSRTTPMHSVLTALTPDEKARVAEILSTAFSDIEAVVRPHLPTPAGE